MDIKIIKNIEKKIIENKELFRLEEKFLNYISTFEKDELFENFWINFIDKNNFIFLEKWFSIVFWDYEIIRYNWKKFSIRLEQKIKNLHLKEEFFYILEVDSDFNYNDEILFYE